MADVRKAALIGGGVIGAGWAARLVHCSVDVALFDPDSQAERKVGEVMANAERAWAKLLPGDSARKGELTLVGSVAEAVAGADYIQESAPERLELKQRLFAEIDETASPDALICSSTSGLLPTELQEKMARPERLLVAHPFNP